MGSRKHCSSKKRYPSKKAAEGAMLGMKRKRGLNGEHFSAYRCNSCGSFHFGHTRGRNPNGRVRRLDRIFERIAQERAMKERRSEQEFHCIGPVGDADVRSLPVEARALVADTLAAQAHVAGQQATAALVAEIGAITDEVVNGPGSADRQEPRGWRGFILAAASRIGRAFGSRKDTRP